MTNRVKRHLLKIRHRHEQRERDKELEGLKYCLEVRRRGCWIMYMSLNMEK